MIRLSFYGGVGISIHGKSHSLLILCGAQPPAREKWTLSARGGGAACSVCSAGYDWKYLNLTFVS